jgi:hypothetical protein
LTAYSSPEQIFAGFPLSDFTAHKRNFDMSKLVNEQHIQLAIYFAMNHRVRWQVATNLPVSGVVPVSQMVGEDDDETERLRKMEQKARDFINQFPWCEGIREFYFGDGIGDVVAIFLAQISQAKPSIDEYLWIVVGELPSAYLVTEDSPRPKEALEGYIWEMRKWVELAKQGRTSEEVIPVNVPPTPEWAEILGSRLDTLEKEIIPQWLIDE